jgi:hypothetical protein
MYTDVLTRHMRTEFLRKGCIQSAETVRLLELELKIVFIKAQASRGTGRRVDLVTLRLFPCELKFSEGCESASKLFACASVVSRSSVKAFDARNCKFIHFHPKNTVEINSRAPLVPSNCKFKRKSKNPSRIQCGLNLVPL